MSFLVLYLAYFKGLFYDKNYSDRVSVKNKGNAFNWIRKSNSTTQKHTNKSVDLVQNGIFWSSYAESLVPKGIIFSSWCLQFSNY